MTRFALLALGLLTAPVRAAAPAPKEGTPCTGSENLLNIPGKWTHRPDVPRGPGLPPTAVPDVTKRIDRIADVFRAAYPEPKGMEAGGYRDLDASPLVQNGPYAYSFRSLYRAWYCNPNTHKLLIGGETATWAYAFVNQLNWFAEPLKTLRVGGQTAFLLTHRIGTFRGLPSYEGIHNQSSNTGTTFSRTILVGRSGRSPLKPVTRKQFLEGYLAAIQAQLDPMLADIERSPVDPAKKAVLVEQRRDQISKLQAPARARLSAMSGAEGEQPAFLSPANIVQFKDFTPEASGGRALVKLDPTYFDPKVNRAAPQFIVVYWRWQKSAPSESFKNEFERRFDPSALNALLDK
ncbi:MAG TPA: hypothetical protein VGG91_21110 [Myxococcaceae bacterium]|jgi:hypothetical protein